MSIYEKRLKFLDDTVNHFNSKNRGMSERPLRNGEMGVGCSYIGGCAIGRHLPEDIALILDKRGDSSGVHEQEVFNQLPTELKSLGQGFLERVQSLHDDIGYWVVSGLSVRGKLQYEDIKNIYCNINGKERIVNPYPKCTVPMNDGTTLTL